MNIRILGFTKFNIWLFLVNIGGLVIIILGQGLISPASGSPRERQPTITANSPHATIKSGSSVVKVKINNEERDWRISPELSPDRLLVECSDANITKVIFTTDKQEQTFELSGDDVIQFNIALDNSLSALTEIKCIAQRARYRGSYSANRSTVGNYSADLNPLLNTYFNEKIPGAVLSIWKNGSLEFQSSIGLANIDTEKHRSLDQPFDIASVTKEFTAVSILQLVEKGKIGLDDKVEKYIQGLPNGKNITIHHLLTHTHGLPDVMQSKDFDGVSPRDVEKTLEWLSEMEIHFQAGEMYEYGNTSYYILSVIVEQVSGQDFKSYIRRNLFQRANMTESYFITDANKQDVRVFGYNESSGDYSLRTFEFHDTQASGTGDIASTLNDMRKWQQSLSNGTVLSKEMFALAVAPKHLNNGTKIDRGYGFAHAIINGEIAIYNTGDLYTHTRHFYLIDQDLSIILNLNGSLEYDGGLASVVFLQIIGKVLNQQTLEMFDETIDVNEL